MTVLRRSVVLAAGALVAVGALAVGAVLAEEEDAGRILFIAEDAQGKVWANLSLTGQRDTEPYIPMVVGVQNLSSAKLKLNRESFWLSDLDDVLYAMPSVKEWRKNYGRASMDRRLLSTGGIPWEVWARSGRFGSTNFFPDLRASRGSTTRDVVTLRQGYGMADLLYFERPRTLERGRPFFLAVQGEGWEVPIRLRLTLP
jgi:hypothetical protein